MNDAVLKAIEYAAQAHDHAYRKGTKTPYVSHPYAVGMLLGAAGCRDEVVAAGILHDTVEDTPVTDADLRREFGDAIADLVAAASEPDKSLPWEERKAHTLASLPAAPLEVKLLVCADKLHNATGIIRDWEREGDAVWARFNRDKSKQLWYYRGIRDGLLQGTVDEPPALFKAYGRAVERLTAIVEGAGHTVS